MSVEDCCLIELPKVSDPRGNLTFIESKRHVPFNIKRIYYLYDVPGGADRGAHGHKKLNQLIVAVSGSFEVVLDDGFDKKKFYLNNPSVGLFICPMIWRDITSFSSGSVCLVLASEYYDEADYFREYSQFLSGVRGE